MLASICHVEKGVTTYLHHVALTHKSQYCQPIPPKELKSADLLLEMTVIIERIRKTQISRYSSNASRNTAMSGSICVQILNARAA